MLDSDASTAKTLTLVAIILQTVFLAFGLFIVFFFLLYTSLLTFNTFGNGTAVRAVAPPLIGIGFLVIILAFSFGTGIIWILLDYFLIYRKLADERVEEAETPCLVLSIVQLVLGGVLAGVLLIIAYVKIKDSVNKRKSAQAQVPAFPRS